MYFKKLELFGFKSFAEKTILHFEPGITAVVGPNGCGKSNIFDGIRWVLGEQSVKSLRGSKMEDIIFNGTESIPALGYAEVSLTFANETKALPIEYDEVTVTRRLFRSGESEYLINKTQVRLKDITELFMGTGIGAESYSLIEQGKIDLILSSRPEDRRLVFDEAAGISKYKSQKRETMRRLEDTEANLLRINDIIVEVKRQISSLERQAAKARRYRELFEKLKELEMAAAAQQMQQYQQKQDEANLHLSALIAQETSDAERIEQLKEEQMRQEAELTQLEQGVNHLCNQAQAIENLISRDIQQLSFNHERIEESKKRILAVDGLVKDLKVKVSQDEDKINDVLRTLDALTHGLKSKKDLELNSKSRLEEITKELHLLKANMQEAKTKILEFASQEAHLNNQMLESTSALNQAIARQKRLHIEKIKIEEESQTAKNDLMQAGECEENAHKRFTQLKEAYEQLAQAASACSSSCDTLKKRIQDLENEKVSLESQREFLSNLKLKYENITESSQALVFLDSLSDTAINGLILKIGQIQNVTEQDGDILGRSLRFKAKGIAKPISLDPQAILEKIEKLASEIALDRGELAEKIGLMDELSQRISASEKNVREQEIEYNNLKTKKDTIQADYKKLEDEHALVLLESEEVLVELDRLKENQTGLKENLNLLKNKARDNEQAIERGLEEIAAKNSERETLLVAITQVSAESCAYEEKISDAHKTKGMLEEAFLKDKLMLTSLTDEENALRNRIAELEVSVKQIEEAVEGSKRQKELLEKESQMRSRSLESCRNNLKDTQGALTERKNILDVCKTKIHELQMQLQEVTFLQNSIYERMQQVYKVHPEELTSALKPEIDAQDLIHEIELLKTKIEAYGQVNLVAIEEFEELKKRFEFLSSQQSDLIKSKESLHEAILKINRTAKKMFLETFEKLAVEFKNYFRLLFGGGDAQLFLLDEQDVLESGIEIVCRPPGKKLQNVLLLSGGEKSMSAIALLFAIFKVKPSPFCVLDEIDAALDEANVDRFSRMLIEFTNQSQFIVITHNKKTIAHANIMYGITMEKAGISKIVSVKLAQDKSVSPPKAQEREGQKVLEPV